MAVKYTNYYNPAYVGLMVGMAASMCRASSKAPTTMPLKVLWNQYLTNAPASAALVGVAINLNQQQVVNPLDLVMSVTIDNLNVPYPVTYRCDDTNFEITCPANGIITKPVLTNSLKSTLFMQKVAPFADPITGTIVYLNNFAMLPDDPLQSVGLQQISNIPGTPASFVNPVVGNLGLHITLDLNTLAMAESDQFGQSPVTDIFQNVKAIYGSGGQVVITSLFVYLNYLIQAPASGTPQSGRFGVALNPDGTTNHPRGAWNFYATSQMQRNLRVEDATSIYLPLALSSVWALTSNLVAGAVYGIFVFDARFAVIT